MYNLYYFEVWIYGRNTLPISRTFLEWFSKKSRSIPEQFSNKLYMRHFILKLFKNFPKLCDFQITLSTEKIVFAIITSSIAKIGNVMIKNAKTRKFKIEDSVINALSEFFEFEIYEIREAYSICNSFDLTLKALENAEANHTTPACESQSLIDKNNEYKIDEKIEKDKYK